MTSSNPQPGSLIGGKYRIDQLLGTGGMGAVYSALHTISGKRVAIKWMHPEVAEHPEARQRFLREAQASARVRHPNVVDVYDVLEEDNALFLVMEFLEGEALSDLMNRESTPITALISLLISAMRGVAAAHREGIVHRDIKPDNIFLARVSDEARPVPKVLDFGISKLTGANDASITKTGMALGTPLYMSVEQLSGLKDIDARTDIYAFGVILYQAVTGQPPFEADTFPVLIAKIMTEQALSPKLVRPDMPTTLSRLIEWAMAKNRDERIGTIDELIRELEPFASDSNFRAQMTIGASDIPSISTPSSRPASVSPGAHRPGVPPSVAPPAALSDPPPSAPPYASPFALTASVPRAPAAPKLDDSGAYTTVPRSGPTALVVGAIAAIALLIAGASWWFSRQTGAESALQAEPHRVVPAITPQATATVTPLAAPPPVAAAPPAETPTPTTDSVSSTPRPAPAVEPPPAVAPQTQASLRQKKLVTGSTPPKSTSATTVTAPAPIAPPSPTEPRHRSRAGRMGLEDF